MANTLTKTNVTFLQSIQDGSHYKKPWRASTDRMRCRLQDAGFVGWSGGSTGHGHLILTDAGRAMLETAKK